MPTYNPMPSYPRALTWKCELSAVPPGAIRIVDAETPTPEGYTRVLCHGHPLNVEETGVYDVPAEPLLEPRERERRRRARERKAARECELAHALALSCERARAFLADLTDLSLSDARQAGELRHRLRTPAREVLREATLFLGGVHPARPGQAALVQDLLRIVAPEAQAQEAETGRRRPTPRGFGMTYDEIYQLTRMP